MSGIKYREGYKYQLAESVVIQTPVKGYDVSSEFYTLHRNGILYIRAGYAWDGASGPTWDTKSSMRGSLIHDVFCQLMRRREVDYKLWHSVVNEFFKELCLEDGMWSARASLWASAVEFADAGDPSQGPDYPILTAP